MASFNRPQTPQSIASAYPSYEVSAWLIFSGEDLPSADTIEVGLVLCRENRTEVLLNPTYWASVLERSWWAPPSRFIGSVGTGDQNGHVIPWVPFFLLLS